MCSSSNWFSSHTIILISIAHCCTFTSFRVAPMFLYSKIVGSPSLFYSSAQWTRSCNCSPHLLSVTAKTNHCFYYCCYYYWYLLLNIIVFLVIRVSLLSFSQSILPTYLSSPHTLHLALSAITLNISHTLSKTLFTVVHLSALFTLAIVHMLSIRTHSHSLNAPLLTSSSSTAVPASLSLMTVTSHWVHSYPVDW